MVYNTLAQDYMKRPTYVRLRGKTEKRELLVEYIPYGSNSPGRDYLDFTKKDVDTYLEHITKFLEWAELATANKDAFDKEIGTAPSVIGMKMKFGFHSGNATTHFLSVTQCVLGSCTASDPMYFDVEGARELVLLLTKLKNGELPGKDVGDKYN